MPFSDRFQLLDLKRDEGARTFEAREIATGRPVFVHLFANTTSPLNRALLAKLETLPEEEGHRILDRGAHESGIYVVTDRLAEFGGLREWLQAKNEGRAKPLDAGGAWQIKAPAPPVPPPLPVPDPPSAPFDTAPLPVLEPSPAEEPPASKLTNSGEQTLQFPTPPDPAPVVTPPPAPAAKEPGEFTRQFAAPVQRPATPPPPASEPGEFTREFAPPVLRPASKETPPSAPNPAARQPGEFTQLFAAPSLKPASPPKAAPPPGEFTRQFQAPQRPAPPPTTPAPRTPPPTTQQPGEFTQMLQAQRPAAPAPPANPSPSSGEFTRYFQSPMTPSQSGALNVTPLTPPRPPSHPKDAGEFTQIFGRGDIPSPPPPPTPIAPSNPVSANATQVFATPRQASPMPMSPPNVPPQGMQQGPGEYTQMFAKPASLTFGQAPAGPTAYRAPEPVPIKRNSSRLPLLLVIGAIVLLIIAVVVYIEMRPHAT